MDRRATLETLKTFVSPYTGVVRRFDEALSVGDGARTVNMVSKVGDRAVLGLVGEFDLSSVGIHYDRDRALGAALGEALERYSGSFPPNEVEPGCVAASELSSNAVRPERFALFSEDQYAQEGFEFEPFTADTRVRWAQGWSLQNGEDVYLPAQLTAMWSYHRSDETMIGFSTSNGMALGATRDEAVLGGLLEAIERDAVMLTWYNRVSLPRLDWSSDPELVERERRYFAPSGVRCEVIDLSLFSGVPVAFSVMRPRSPDDPKRFMVSAAAAATMREAWDKAMREIFQGRSLATHLLHSRPERSLRDDFSDIETFEDHAHFYLRPENEAHVAFLDGSEETRDIGRVASVEGGTAAERIDAIVDRLKARNVSAYAVDLTVPEIREAGLHVVKVICPELQQLDVSYRLRLLGGRRLYHAAFEAGLRDAPLTADQLNHYPHPFP